MGWASDRLVELVSQAQEGDLAAQVELLHHEFAEGLFGFSPTLDAAADYLLRGWSIVPQLPGEKMPCVKWKEFQQRRPKPTEVYEWYRRWPDAGIALVLGTNGLR